MKPPEKFAHSLLEGDHKSAWDMIHRQMNEGASTLDLFEGLITKAMRYIGELWENNEVTVADEHLATSTCDYILAKYHYLLREKNGNPSSDKKKAMFLCVQDEDHYLGLKMVHILFEENGWETKFMGPNLPLEYAVSAAQSWQPHVIGLSFSLSYRAGVLKYYIEKLEAIETEPTVLLGGRLLATHDFTQYGSERTCFVPSLYQLADWFHLEQSGGGQVVK
ncbi:cobalamin-binding protein [Bacillus sp. FJAT-42376]|uniref:cobalamin B12-binding domain-containing protein n=1 Tax=Bacillus sp. FJAT-42376 TaxID=2014076 RepID=UPI000F4EFF31|nr:B12-binding domain-containing protein [Bacillus sp. FJAT-42376]AZB41639.1 cobalamin-binding protein [Bacillus sp. FJAT-42376]